MKYLITGGAGFIGSRLAKRLVEKGNKVLILDDLSTGTHENVESFDDGKNVKLIVNTVNNSKIVEECVESSDKVFHLASAVGVQLILDEPVKSIKSIVGGTEEVLSSCAKHKKPVLLTSTSEVYGKGVKIPFNEEDDRLMGPTTKRRWSYACSKAVDEFLALAHWHSSKLPVIITRLFNTVGPGQTGRYGMVIPRLVKQAVTGKPLTVYGTGKQQRCFAHVSDVTEALIKLMDCSKTKGEIFNVGNNKEISILELAEKIKEISGSQSKIEFVSYKEAYGEGFDEMQRRVPDLTKIKTTIDYNPKFSIDEILKNVIDYEKSKLQ